MEVKHIISFN